MFWMALACTGPAPVDDTSHTDTALVDTGPDPWTDALDLGALSGECPLLAHAWTSDEPSLLLTVLDLDSGFDEGLLSTDGATVWEAGNLGGSSAESEVVSMEVLYGCDGATLVATEADIPYTDEGKKGDLYVEAYGNPMLVSVTRAFNYPDPEGGVTPDGAAELLDKKVSGLVEATGLLDGDSDRSLLHVLAYGENDTAAVTAAWETVDHQGVLLMVTQTDGDDAELY